MELLQIAGLWPPSVQCLLSSEFTHDRLLKYFNSNFREERQEATSLPRRWALIWSLLLLETRKIPASQMLDECRRLSHLGNYLLLEYSVWSCNIYCVLTTHRLAYLCCQCDASPDIKLALGLVVARSERWRYPLSSPILAHNPEHSA